jgi:NADH-quinone oxidoreductase subunit M
MSDAILLNVILFLPVIGGIVLLALPRTRDDLVRGLSMLVMILQLVLAVWLYLQFEARVPGLQFETRVPWIAAWGVHYHVGMDGLNLLLVLLTAFLGPLVVASAFSSITRDVKLFHGLLLFLQFTMIGTFLAQDLFLFYVFWEAMLIPMFLMIGMWGGERRIYATLKFFLYTAFGSILMLAAVIYLGYFVLSSTGAPSFAFADLYALDLPVSTQTWLLAAFGLSFAIKVPMMPLHTWLPDAHVEAPTAGSVILAGVLLKMGAYGFLRFSLPMLPDASQYFAPMIYVLSVVAVIYTSLVALAQEDMKKLIAYSSVAHMGIVTLGIFTFNQQGIEGALFTMLAHGVVSGALFLCVGVLYDREHTREIARYGGVAKIMPAYALVFMLFTMASVALPGTAGFPGEFLVLVGAWAVNPWVALGAATGMVLGACYMLRLYRGVAFGRITRDDLKRLLDLSPREYAVFSPLIVLTLWMGVYPQSFLSFFSATVSQMVLQHEAAINAASRFAGVVGQ